MYWTSCNLQFTFHAPLRLTRPSKVHKPSSSTPRATPTDWPLPFPFIFSQSSIISLRSPIKRGDITSPFLYTKRGKSICGNTSLKLRKIISLYGKRKEKNQSVEVALRIPLAFQSPICSTNLHGIHFVAELLHARRFKKSEQINKGRRWRACMMNHVDIQRKQAGLIPCNHQYKSSQVNNYRSHNQGHHARTDASVHNEIAS